MSKKENVDPWGSKLLRNYEDAFDQFGLSKFNNSLKLDYYLFKRNIIIAHRDFNKVFNRIKDGKPFIQMTGIASSGKLHFGHKIDIDLFVFLSKLKNSKNYFSIADIDAYCSREKFNSLEETKKFAIENIAHALALGVPKEAIYLQSKKESRYYNFSYELAKKITKNTFEATYGHVDLGKIQAGLLQYTDILHTQLKEYEGKMPSITGIGLDQDPHAKITRDLARKFKLELPSFIYFAHQGGLQQGKKMSSSEPDTAIFLDDSDEEIKKKIANTFTGGRNTLKEQTEKGGKPEICKIYEFQRFHNSNDKEIEEIYKRCKSGNLLCGECKQLCLDFILDFIEKHRKNLKKSKEIAEKLVSN